MQGSAEWHEARRGKVTGSRFADVLRGRSGKSLTAEIYMFDLIAEVITGRVSEQHGSRATDWGTANEAEARMQYIMASGEVLTEVGFIDSTEMPGVGCSPDALVGTEGILEIKCPYNTSVHLKTILSGKVPDEYEPQVHGNMWVTGRQWCDFVSYDPRVQQAGLSYFCIRVKRDEGYIEQIAETVSRFRQQLDIKLAKLIQIGKEQEEGWGL